VHQSWIGGKTMDVGLTIKVCDALEICAICENFYRQIQDALIHIFGRLLEAQEYTQTVSEAGVAEKSIHSIIEVWDGKVGPPRANSLSSRVE